MVINTIQKYGFKFKNKHPRRIYYLFLVIIFFLASTEIAYSQVKNLSLHLTNVTLEEALAQIKQRENILYGIAMRKST